MKIAGFGGGWYAFYFRSVDNLYTSGNLVLRWLHRFEPLNDNNEPMTAAQITLVKRTWKIIMGIDQAIVGDAFYSKLFAEHPSLRKMFPKDMSLQYQKLLDMLTSIVMRLDNLDEISKEIEEMANRHLGYGVKPVHYNYVGNALLWTLEKALGNGWTPDVKEAWATCYNSLAAAMINTPA